jgi:hypothetical protein
MDDEESPQLYLSTEERFSDDESEDAPAESEDAPAESSNSTSATRREFTNIVFISNSKKKKFGVRRCARGNYKRNSRRPLLLEGTSKLNRFCFSNSVASSSEATRGSVNTSYCSPQQVASRVAPSVWTSTRGQCYKTFSVRKYRFL